MPWYLVTVLGLIVLFVFWIMIEETWKDYQRRKRKP